jgi:ABC-2 type transport system ATP-binding protein
MDAVAKEIRNLPGVAELETDPQSRSVTAFPGSGGLILPAVSELASQRGWALEQLHLESGRLDEVFRTITVSEATS